MRGAAVLMVLVSHCFSYTMQSRSWSLFPHILHVITYPLGPAGVELFFVLSGYLITGILLDGAGQPRYFRNFYARRALRILPLYYLTLLLIAVLYKGSLAYVLLGAVYLSNISPIFGVAALYGPLWSLSVEEHFYLVWPWIVHRVSRRGLAAAALGICLVEPVVRIFAYSHGYTYGVYYYSWFRFDGLATGALLALFVRSRWFSRKSLYYYGLVSFGAAGLLGAVCPRTEAVTYALDFTYLDLIFLSLMAVTLSGELSALGRFFRSRWIVYCGEVSYFLYIFHWMLFYEWDRLVGQYPKVLVSTIGAFGTLLVHAAVVGALCFSLAELSRRYFEGPILRLKRRFASAAPAPADSSLDRNRPPSADGSVTRRFVTNASATS